MTPVNFSLKWKDFHQNIVTSIDDYRQEEKLFDVTLVSDDDKQFLAHKIILSACSLFFQRVFFNNPHSHPLLYMKGVNSNHLQSILDFIYLDEVEVNQHSFA